MKNKSRPTPLSRFTFRVSHFTSLVKPGDWLTLCGTLILVGASFATLWQGGKADKAIIRSGGKVFARASLDRNLSIMVPGPLGTSRITIRNGRARVEADPSPRQYCVRQGWLKNAGDIAVCLPNQVSLELVGRAKRYDSLNY